ncbi:hypothetical protein Tco_0777079 [Tanacetum coccineum]
MEEVWFTIYDENEIFQDFLNTSESSNDKTNVVNAPQEPFVLNQDPGENSSQRPPHIDHHCCYGCGDSLDGIFCQQCTCKSCGNGAHYGYHCPPQVPIIYNPEPCNNQTVDELPQTFPSFDLTCYSGEGNLLPYVSKPNFVDDSPNYFFIHQPPHEKTIGELLAKERAANIDQSPPQEMSIQDMEDLKQHYLDEMKSLIDDLQIKDYHNERIDIQYRRESYVRTSQQFNFIYYDDDGDEESFIPWSDIISELPLCIAITPVLSTKDLVDSLIMEEHLDTILATESNEVIKSSVEDLVPIPSESEGIPDNMCDVPFRDNSLPLDISKDQFEDFSYSNDDSTSIDDDSFSIDDIDYVDASPPDSELVSLEEVKDLDPEDGGINHDILLIKDDILREKLLNINLLIAKIEALKDNPTPSSDFVTKSPSTSPKSFLDETNISYNSLSEFETFCFNLEEKSTGNPTSYTDLSLPDYEAFFCDSKPDSRNFPMDVVEDIFDNRTREPRVHVPNVLPTCPTLYLDSNFTPSSDSLGSDFVVSFPSGTRNKIFDPGIFIEVQSKRFLSPNEFSIPFIRDPLSPVFDTLLPFSSENEDKDVNPGILAAGEEKSPHLLSYWGFKAFQLISKSPMMIFGGDIPILDVPIAPDFEASRAHGFVLRSLELQILSFIMGIQYPNLID